MKQFYFKLCLCFITILFCSISISAQKSKSLWTKRTKDAVSKTQKLIRNSEPSKAIFYQLNSESLNSILKTAPNRNRFKGVSNVIVSFPTENGNFESFRIKEASTMTPELQAKFPNIRSYSGQGIENPSAIIRFSYSPEKGLSSMVLSDKNTVFIEPYTSDLSSYIVYARTSTDKRPEFLCETENIKQSADFGRASVINANDGKLRTFRLALACTGEYATFHGGTTAGTLAAMNTTMTRINGVFERDVALTMQMVNNTSIIFLDGATDPYSNNNVSAMLGENQTTCDTNIGADNYDIGHVFSTADSGVAYLSSACGGSKAGGVTGSSSPTGDSFDIDFVAHEMGHQFGANHTQNNNCARNNATAVEPGSASTIMGYAGICSPNVQNNSDDYFHNVSILEMWNNITTGASQCATESNTGNNAPTADAGLDYTIPKSTPFVLRGVGTDADTGNSLTYGWNQIDNTPATMPPVSTSTAGPAFRSLQPKTSADRYMPDLATVVGGATSSTWEVVPSVARTMNFSLTVRDNVAGGASSASDNTVITVNGTAGPFQLTSQTTNETWEIGSTQTVTWDVANTDMAPVNTTNVNILLSIDGGLTFPFTLVSNGPNDGSHDVAAPIGTTTTQARVIVEGAGNIFYAVNSTNFTIVNTEFLLVASNPSIDICQPDTAVYNFTYNTFSGFSETTVFSANNVPTGATVSFSPISASVDGTTVTMTISKGASTVGNYLITAIGTAPSATYSTDVTLNIFGSSINATTLVSPINGAIDLIPPSTTLSWVLDNNAQDYLIEIATDNGFSNIVDSATVQTSNYTTTVLISNTQYYWRVTASNLCATATASSIYSFITAIISCDFFTATDTPITIGVGGGNKEYFSAISVTPDLPILDVNVTIDITHTYDADLDITLTSPTGTVVTLTSANGANRDNYTNTVFDQEGSTAITSGSPPFIGTFVPEGDLSILNGETSGGNWTLTVTDTAAGDGGSIDGFTLELCVQGTLSINETRFDKLTIFPNPNSGEFTVKLSSDSGNDIIINVYDIRGRKVFNNAYKNGSSNFNEVINLGNVQSGIYLLNISDGFRSTTKKIIVN